VFPVVMFIAGLVTGAFVMIIFALCFAAED